MMTPAIMRSVIHAASRWEPKKRDLRSRRLGAFFSRMMEKTTRATRTAQAKKSSMKPTQFQVPMSGMWKYLLKRSP